ncbi:37S ribosomal protein S9 [Penicillium malachiteum]|nr:37S ribosomal protein S9 [Penicillium malachiteum]
MARHTPNGIVQAMQSLRISNSLASRPNIPSLRYAARKYATEAQPESATESVIATETEIQIEAEAENSMKTQKVKAAPAINFEKFNIAPARIIPASPSYFSGSPRFIDHVLRLEALKAKFAHLPIVDAAEAPRMAWLKLAQFRDFVGEPVPVKKYKSLLKILQSMNRIAPDMVPGEVRNSLASFLRPGNPYSTQHSPREVDEMGRARAKGKRKESTAVVQLVEGEGEVLVNGKSLVEVFQRLHDRESALWPLRCVDRLDKYNVWATVHGGGVTGQAEAITLAIARALLLHEPGLKSSLRKAGVITVDARRVERKKAGHVKARKMPTWVKR